MKTLSAQHRELAIQYFESYPGEDVLHISIDGQVFLNANRNDAANHQRSLSPGEPLVTVSRKDLGAYAPPFDYNSMTDEEKAVYDAELAEVQKEELLEKIKSLALDHISNDLSGKTIDELIAIIKDHDEQAPEGSLEERPADSEAGTQEAGQDLTPVVESNDLQIVVEDNVVPTTDAIFEDLKTPDSKKPKSDKKVIKK